MTKGIYGAFNKQTKECIYIGKSNSSMQARWRAHEKAWKKDKPIHRQLLFTQYLYFFEDQIEWQVLIDLDTFDQEGWQHGDAALLEVLEHEAFLQCKPIANAYIPNGWDVLRSIESGGQPYPISEWNPYAVEIRVKKGEFAGFSDGKAHFVNPRVIARIQI